MLKIARWLVGLCVFLSFISCSEKGEVMQTPYKPSVTVHQMMTWYLEPAADEIWGSAGFIITEEGEVDLQPTTQEGWDRVRNNATIVAEGGNLLMMPGMAADAEGWSDYARGLVDAGIVARRAAIDQDADALFNAGGQIYNVCKACHNRYMNELEN